MRKSVQGKVVTVMLCIVCISTAAYAQVFLSKITPCPDISCGSFVAQTAYFIKDNNIAVRLRFEQEVEILMQQARMQRQIVSTAA